MSQKKIKSKTLGLVLCNLLGCLAFQHLDAAWSTPVTISDSESDNPDITVDAAGNVVLIWQAFDGSNYVVQASNKPVLGSWSNYVTLSDSGQDANCPEIVHDASGNVVAVWSRYDGTYSIVQSSQLPIGGAWSNPVNVSATGGNADSCELAMDVFGTVGNAIAVWHRYNGSNFIVQGATLPSGGSWTSALNISASGADALVPQVDIDSEGNAVITCTRWDGDDFDILSASQLYSQTWGPNFTLNVPGDTNALPMVQVNKANGTGHVMWSQFDGSNYIIQFSSLTLGGSWTTAESLSASGNDAYAPDFVVDALGNIKALWVQFDGSNWRLYAADKPVLGSWSTPVTISPEGYDVGYIEICVDPTGKAYATWDVNDGTTSKVQASTCALLGSWETPVDISTTGVYAYQPEVDVDALGNATAVWLESNGSYFVVVTATLPSGS